MRKRRSRIIGWASALAAGFVSVPSADAQMPASGQMPVTPPAMAPEYGPAGPVPVQPTGPVPMQPVAPGGPIRRAFRHVCFTLKDQFIGYPDLFSEPPLGFYVYETFGQMKARAETHNFMLYRSDFMPDSTALSPNGAQRLSLMAARLPKWLGPVVVEWTPDKPGLAEQRKGALLAALQGAGVPIVAERILVGPSPYPGELGPDANNNYGNMIIRDTRAAQDFSVTPSSTESFGGGNR